MIDESLFWSLGGPSGFIRDIAQAIERNGMVAVQVPNYHPAGLHDAVVRGLVAAGLGPVHRVNKQSRGSIVHRMAFSAGEYRHSFRSVGAMLDAPSLRGSAFLVDQINPAEWSAWVSFVRSFGFERRRRRGAVLLPVLVVFVPSDLPREDLERLFPGSIVQWRGRVSSFDMRSYVAARTGRTQSDDLLERAAVELAIGLAGYDPLLVDLLCRQSPLDAVDPWELLIGQYGDSAEVHPHWGNGLVDTVDGEVFVHTASLLASRDRKAFDVRRWRAISGPVLDFNATVCRHFADTYSHAIERCLPYKVVTNYGEQLMKHRYDMENKHLRDCLDGVLERHDVIFLKATSKARNNIAHNEVPAASLLNLLSSTWRSYEVAERKELVGWTWPRCNQRLIVLIGPSGAGKSTYAKANFADEEIVSSDDIRMELFGSHVVAGTQSRIFEIARERLTRRMAGGASVVFDATNLRRNDRLQIVDLVPIDMEIEYVVIDRDIEEKRRDGGWRNERENLIDGQARLFAEELDQVLKGDNRANIRVTDRRSLASEAA